MAAGLILISFSLTTGEMPKADHRGDIVHLLAHEGREQLPAHIPEECPDQAQGGDDIVGIDFFALPVGGLWFGGFEFDRPALFTKRSACARVGLLRRRRAFFRSYSLQYAALL
jgi:hypothetical protein